MFGFFKKKTAAEKLQDQYEKLIKEVHKLSTVDRKASDLKAYEADQVLKKIDELSSQAS